MTKFNAVDLLSILEEKNELFDLVEEELTHEADCDWGQAIFHDKNTDKYYRFNYVQFDTGEYHIPRDTWEEVEEVKKMLEISETLKDGLVVSSREIVHFDEIYEDE